MAQGFTLGEEVLPPEQAKPPPQRSFLDPAGPARLPADRPTQPAITPPSPSFELTDEFADPAQKSLRTRGWERLTGQDVYDPVEWPRLGTTIMGGILGGEIGSRFPLNPILGSVAGSAGGVLLGTMAPEMVMELGERLHMLPPGFREEHGLSYNDLRTIMMGEAIVDIATNGGLLGARLLGRGLSTATTGAGAYGRIPDPIAADARGMGINLLPVQVGDRKIARGYINIFGRMPWMAGPLKAQAEATTKELRKVVDELPQRLAPVAYTMTGIGPKLLESTKGTLKTLNDTYTRKFDTIFADADNVGIRVQPINTITEAERMLKDLDSFLPKGASGEAIQGNKLYREMRDFIQTNVIPMKGETATQISWTPQTLQQMDTLLSNIDAFKLKLEKQGGSAMKGSSGDRAYTRVLSMVNELSNHVFADNLGNAVQRSPNNPNRVIPITPNSPAHEVLQRFQATSNELSTTMADIFDTAAAKNMGAYRSRLLRGGEVKDTATTKTPENLARFFLDSESPQLIGELKKLVDPTTFNQLSSSVFDHIVTASQYRGEGGVKMFDPETFSKLTGIDNPKSGRYQQMEALLQNSGLKMKDLETVVEAANRIADVPIPDVSTFVARRSALGGLRAGIASMATTALAGYAAGSTSGNQGIGVGGAVLTSALAIGGSRLFAKIISNPNSAQALSDVMRAEASITMRRAAAAKALRLAIWAGANNEWSREEAHSMDEKVKDIIDGLGDAMEAAKARETGKK